jgi:EAL domain-containing protein (putative c-di-GMP-specific phosphodiesterase class I)
VVKALAEIARGMGRRTIAEFVGDERTVGLLRAYGVDYAQGFALGRPQPSPA